MATISFDEATRFANLDGIVLYPETEKENHGYFSSIRVDRTTLPEGWHAYDIRGNDEDGDAYCIEKGYVMVNHFGTILTKKEIEFKKNDDGSSEPIILDEIDWSYEDGDKVDEFISNEKCMASAKDCLKSLVPCIDRLKEEILLMVRESEGKEEALNGIEACFNALAEVFSNP